MGRIQKVKGQKQNTEDNYVEAGNAWYLETATNNVYHQRQTLVKKR